mmetsp:Transcript_43506/g.51220  ORF Transcript_43506/g.51220 Transcript_43506/m.51220 type:complete len:169 (+) Transcript_43506:282-788(+)
MNWIKKLIKTLMNKQKADPSIAKFNEKAKILAKLTKQLEKLNQGTRRSPGQKKHLEEQIRRLRMEIERDSNSSKNKSLNIVKVSSKCFNNGLTSAIRELCPEAFEYPFNVCPPSTEAYLPNELKEFKLKLVEDPNWSEDSTLKWCFQNSKSIGVLDLFADNMEYLYRF